MRGVTHIDLGIALTVLWKPSHVVLIDSVSEGGKGAGGPFEW